MDLEASLQKLLARASLLGPEPPALARLSRLRGRIADELLFRRRDELVRARLAGGASIAQIAESLVAEHRRAMSERAGETGWARIPLRLGERLPTDEDEFIPPGRGAPISAGAAPPPHDSLDTTDRQLYPPNPSPPQNRRSHWPNLPGSRPLPL